MVKTKIHLIPLMLSLGILLMHCAGNGENGQSEEEKVENTTAQATTQPEEDNPVLMEAYAKAKEDWFIVIEENEKLISGLKSAIIAEKEEERGDREKKLHMLEQLNNKQKTKIALFKPNNEENWNRFRTMLTTDLNQVNDDLLSLKKK